MTTEEQERLKLAIVKALDETCEDWWVLADFTGIEVVPIHGMATAATAVLCAAIDEAQLQTNPPKP